MAFTPVTVSATKRRNAFPVSSILYTDVKDIDCSGLTVQPEDGQFIPISGDEGDLCTAELGGINYAAAITSAVDMLSPYAMAKMVWGSRQRTDRHSLGNSRVPVIYMNTSEFETVLYNTDSTQALNHANNFPIGSYVGIYQAQSAIEGSQDRLVVTSLPAIKNLIDASGAGAGDPADMSVYAFAQVVGTSSDTVSESANAKPLTLRLLDHPVRIALADVTAAA